MGPEADALAAPGAWREVGPGLELRALECDRHALVSVRLRDAAELPAFAFQRQTAEAYERLGRHLRRIRSRHAVRLWNYIPRILEPLGELAHRYMVFNAGRYAAYTRWYRHRDRFDRYVATASGVGHPGTDLWIHCLADRVAGEPVENPRQVAAYRYSERYGPRPPCFARATRVGPMRAAEGEDRRRLLVGGTAAVLGEDSLHPGDLQAQIDETFLNLAALPAAASAAAAPTTLDTAAEQLARYRSLRVYHVRAADRTAIAHRVALSFPRAADVELVHADLCRPELLVEIEGVAELAGG